MYRLAMILNLYLITIDELNEGRRGTGMHHMAQYVARHQIPFDVVRAMTVVSLLT